MDGVGDGYVRRKRRSDQRRSAIIVVTDLRTRMAAWRGNFLNLGSWFLADSTCGDKDRRMESGCGDKDRRMESGCGVSKCKDYGVPETKAGGQVPECGVFI